MRRGGGAEQRVSRPIRRSMEMRARIRTNGHVVRRALCPAERTYRLLGQCMDLQPGLPTAPRCVSVGRTLRSTGTESEPVSFRQAQAGAVILEGCHGRQKSERQGREPEANAARAALVDAPTLTREAAPGTRRADSRRGSAPHAWSNTPRASPAPSASPSGPLAAGTSSRQSMTTGAPCSGRITTCGSSSDRALGAVGTGRLCVTGSRGHSGPR
jgi:hypothetical protein